MSSFRLVTVVAQDLEQVGPVFACGLYHRTGSGVATAVKPSSVVGSVIQYVIETEEHCPGDGTPGTVTVPSVHTEELLF